MGHYENEADAKYKTGVTIDDRYTMQQIWDELDDAIEKYQKKGTQGLRGRVRGVGRKIGKHSEVVEGWLGLLPTQSQYLSVVLGGLKLIIKVSAASHMTGFGFEPQILTSIKAAGRMKGVSDEIMVALSELPAMFDTTKRAQTLYGAKSLEAITWELYTSMVKALGHILEYLRRSLHRKILKAWLQHSRFENELSEKIKDMKACKDRFIEEVDMCEKEMVGRIDSRTKTTEDTVHEIHLSTNMLVKLLLGNPAVLDLAYEFRKAPNSSHLLI
ncbi:hypothetical protein SLS55_004999 [Diplodia seriata]|uniref:Uncharacterized protein n=1 Tax=Diplodia seriata TaxID=420778 RepID=A0ABR3CKX9_9PEZI